ncbi:hypothetical protein PM082_001698 [Marasmius tenuissimus]|nr:hypothetical protein PM082_001698 [Marasmius tenuissimus]
MLKGVVPGEAYWLGRGIYKIGMLAHLGTVLPAGFLAVFQFVPAIRYKAIPVHRLFGGVCFLIFALRRTAFAFVITRRSMGGDIATQSGLFLLGTVTLVSATIAWLNIKKLQIDQHRKWMLIHAIGQYSTVWSCAEVLFTIDNNSTQLEELYPVCISGQLDTIHVAVPATRTVALNIGSSLRMSFGSALWIALFLHAVGVEIYIHLTPGESARLRKVSYQRQLEKGMPRSGSMGTVGDRLGDNLGVEYKPQ